MKETLVQWWASRSVPQRQLIGLLAFALLLVLYVWLVRATTQARDQLVTSVAELRVEATHQGQQADEILRLRAAPAPVRSDADLRQIVRRSAASGGLDGALVSVEPVGTDQVKVVFGQVAFTDWLVWADAMRAQQLRFAAVRIESQIVLDQVSVTATLDRSGR